jgi:hypothetical protein
MSFVVDDRAAGQRRGTDLGVPAVSVSNRPPELVRRGETLWGTPAHHPASSLTAQLARVCDAA